MPAMGPFVPPTDSMSGRGDTETPQVGHVPEGPATAAPTKGGAAAALREGEVRQVGQNAPAPEDFDRPVPPGDQIQAPKTGGRGAKLQLHQKEGKNFVEEPGYITGSNTAVHRILPQAALMMGHGTSAGQQGVSECPARYFVCGGAHCSCQR
ncbi:hypothetical protein DUNSADRAFT_7727 [Dunaliella salina]|uniref:Encoded protein n=1 Tax=Dunaliella salina TaxID=3046 RepID=A0ABQ7GL27_DUNSA|nr:hypothetical protein DUNSADRAFT_7727 [Dunaliella salina]|eukprot:KAF5835238.1 hypothetical protein DUNSADRAFT_7727 [Dunaliella salina]